MNLHQSLLLEFFATDLLRGLGLFAGCLCCNTDADVVGAVTKLLEAGGEIDHLVIECSGMAQVQVLAYHGRHDNVDEYQLNLVRFVLCGRNRTANHTRRKTICSLLCVPISLWNRGY